MHVLRAGRVRRAVALTGSMAEPWYKGYFSPAFWQLARAEYSRERTEKEIRYLRAVLGPLDGLRVLDLGCGTGRHAVALAEAGAVVTGIDIASEHASALAPAVRFLVGDLLLDSSWPDEEFDAIVCIQSLGWGSEADQRRFLRNCRRRLSAQGVFVLDSSNVYQITRRFSGSASCVLDGVRFDFERSFDVLTARNSGSLTATAAESAPSRLFHDFQLYSPHVLISELQRAGFSVQRADADFEAGEPVTLDTRYVQLIATPAPCAPQSLAVHTHSGRSRSALDLMWAPDEVEWLTHTPEDILRDCSVTTALRHYPLDDPYGARRSRTVLESFFDTSLPESSITFGAGITSLLRQLAPLADGGTIVCPRWSFPDYAAWAHESGARVLIRDHQELLHAALESRATVVAIERPTVFGQSASLEALASLATQLRSIGCVLLVDEAYHAYYAGRDSAVPTNSGANTKRIGRSRARFARTRATPSAPATPEALSFAPGPG